MAKKPKPNQGRKSPPPPRQNPKPTYKAPMIERRPPRVPGR